AFSDGTRSIRACDVTSAACSISISSGDLTSGSRYVTATYSGDAVHGSATDRIAVPPAVPLDRLVTREPEAGRRAITSGDEVVQTFTAGTTGDLATIVLSLGGDGALAGVEVAIHAASGGTRTGPALASVTVPADALSSAIDDLRIDLPTRPRLTGGVAYAISIVPVCSGDCTLSGPYRLDDPSDGGSLVLYEGDALTIPSGIFDLPYATYVDPTPGPLASLAIDPIGDRTAGTPFTVTVRGVDADGRPVDPTGGTSVTTTAGPSPDGDDATTSTISWSDGIGTFSMTAYDATAGATVTVEATGTDVPPATSAPFAILPAAPDELRFTTAPSGTYTADDGLTAGVEVVDEYGNRVTAGDGADAAIGLELTGGTAGATTDGTWTGTASGGQAGFAGIGVRTPGSDYALVASAAGIDPTTSTTFAITPGALASLELSGATDIVAGGSLTILVTAWDAHGNVKTDYVSTPSLGGDAFDATDGCLDCGSPIEPTSGTGTTGDWSAGVGTFQVVAYRAGTARTLTVSDGAVSDGTTFTVAPAALGGLRISDVADTSAGSTFDVTVDAYDVHGNPKTDDPGGRPLAGSALLASPGCATCGTPSVPTSATDGTATTSGATTTYASVLVVRAVTAATLTVVDGSVSDGTTFTIAPAALATFDLADVADTTAGSAFDVAAVPYDGFGNVVIGYAGTAALSGTWSVASPGCDDCGIDSSTATTASATWDASARTVRFAGLVPVAADTGATLVVSDGAASDGTTFTIAPAALAALSATTEELDAASAGDTTGVADQTAGAGFTLRVWAFDRFGNVRPDGETLTLGGTWDATSPGCGACDGGGTAATTGVAGSWAWATDHAAVELTAFTATDLLDVTTATIEVSSGAIATTERFTVYPAFELAGLTLTTAGDLTAGTARTTGLADRTAGAAFTVEVWAYDAYGNVNSRHDGGAVLSGAAFADSPGCDACGIAAATATTSDGTWAPGSGHGTYEIVLVDAAVSTMSVSDGTGLGVATTTTIRVVPEPLLAGLSVNSSAADAATARAANEIDDQTAGSGFAVTVWAFDRFGNVLDADAPATPPTLTGAWADRSPDCPACGTPITGSAGVAAPRGGFAGGNLVYDLTAYTATNRADLTSATIVVTSGSVSVESSAFTIAPAALGGFDLADVPELTAGSGVTIAATAHDRFGNRKTDLGGAPVVSGTALDASPGCAACSPSIAVATGSADATTWTPATATATWTLTAFRARSGATLAVAAEGISDGTTFTVAPATTVSGLTVSDPGLARESLVIADGTAGTPFAVRTTAYDAYGNLATWFDGTGLVLGGLGASPGCPTCAPVIPAANAAYGTVADPSSGIGTWSGGIGTWLVTAVDATTAATVSVALGGVGNVSAPFEVGSAAELAGLTAAATGEPAGSEAIGERTAGTSFDVTVHLYDAYGNIGTDFGGAIAATGSWDDTSPGCAAGICAAAALDATGGTWTALGAWSDGSRTYRATAYRSTRFDAEVSSATLVLAASGTAVANETASFAIRPAIALAGLSITTTAGLSAAAGDTRTRTVADQTAGTPFAIRLWAYDAYGNVNDRHVGDPSLSDGSWRRSAPGCAATTCGSALPALAGIWAPTAG
ncbi:MAG: hypothetical protein RL338_330, partial [Chloroflexota bacterium]